ncbi:MAG TPA: alpha/beta hydrolase, partial [Terriglobales bacterium]|nr:alpha/beta hydrolase [Terriglobales bacterium]
NQTHVVGSSHGGTLVMVAGALAPERFHHIVAVSPANGISEQSRWQATVFSAWWGRWAGYCVPYVAPLIHGYFLSRMYADRTRVLPGTVQGYNAPLKEKGTVRYLLAVMKHWKNEFRGLHARLSALQDARLTFLWGEEDTVVRMSCREELLRDFPRAKFVVMPNAGHLPYEERPELFNQMLLECLQEQ